MKVILKQEVAGLGHAGEVKEVAPGYARNFLVLRGLADLATPERLEQLKRQQVKQQKEFEKLHQKWQEVIQDLPNFHPVFKRKASKLGKLFAAIGVDQVALALAEKTKVKIDPAAITTDKPIKSLGEHTVKVAFSPDLHGEFQLTVLPE